MRPRSGRYDRMPTTTSAPALAERNRSRSSSGTWPSAGTRKIQSPRACRSAVVMAPEKPRFIPWWTTRKRGSLDAIASAMSEVPAVLSSATTRISPSPPAAAKAASASATTGLKFGASSYAIIAMVTSIRASLRAAPRDKPAGSRQTRGSLRQDIFRLAEREADEMASELAAREEGRAGHAGDADLADEPVRELGVVVEAEGRDVAEHVVRARRRVRREPRGRERGDEQVATRAVIPREPLVVRATEPEPDRDRLLQGRGRAHGDEVVHLADPGGEPGWRHDPADAPARHRERLAGAGDRDRPFGHALERGDRDVLAGVEDVLVDLVRHGDGVVLAAERGDELDLGAREHPTRGVVRGVHVGVDRALGGLLQLRGRGEVRKALRQVDAAVDRVEPCHLADDGFGEADRAGRQALAGDPH